MARERQFRADEELAHRLPRPDTVAVCWAPKRRPALAHCSLAGRLASLAELDPMRGDDQTLTALASGTRLLSLELQLRSQALELWMLLELPTRMKFQDMPPSLAEWNRQFDSTALLHREQRSLIEGGSQFNSSRLQKCARALPAALFVNERRSANSLGGNSWHYTTGMGGCTWFAYGSAFWRLARRNRGGEATGCRYQIRAKCACGKTSTHWF